MSGIQELLGQIARMRWSDYLDIALVAFMIYKLLPLIRTPSTMRIAGSVVGILVVVWLADVAKLYTISWILSQFLSVGLLAVVILFQPELRRMLDRLGSVRLRSLLGISKPVQEMDTVISQTVMACEIMSRERVGALIVFARETRLEEYFKTGTRINGQVSEQLIRNIFFPKASLHDGAMIIRDGQIAAAGCVLPLSETVGGMLKRHLAPQTLERLLHNELTPAQNEPDSNMLARLKEKLLQNEKEERKDEK